MGPTCLNQICLIIFMIISHSSLSQTSRDGRGPFPTHELARVSYPFFDRCLSFPLRVLKMVARPFSQFITCPQNPLHRAQEHFDFRGFRKLLPPTNGLFLATHLNDAVRLQARMIPQIPLQSPQNAKAGGSGDGPSSSPHSQLPASLGICWNPDSGKREVEKTTRYMECDIVLHFSLHLSCSRTNDATKNCSSITKITYSTRVIQKVSLCPKPLTRSA
ncbi:hypothetical protein BJ322DRAFT_205066 [Thelephora terrestris]|uniref:Secreted protein n=1 Tax=Thelephora terrestris TaxID=56493 RepID=A0A9P6L3W3_9AGAM|nr:hypothetical protein BJ322DRAFT_205066 [Thelephora terrestris]